MEKYLSFGLLEVPKKGFLVEICHLSLCSEVVALVTEVPLSIAALPSSTSSKTQDAEPFPD